MKIEVKVLEAKDGYAVSGYGADTGSVTIRQGETAVLEGSVVSVSGTDGIGKAEVSTADTPPPPN